MELLGGVVNYIATVNLAQYQPRPATAKIC
jgi:hypothetical protein